MQWVCEQNVSGLQAEGGLGVMSHTPEERQGFVLTNQCLGKEEKKEGAEESFLPNGQRETYSSETLIPSPAPLLGVWL